MKSKSTLILALLLATGATAVVSGHAAAPEFFSQWPAGAEPADVGTALSPLLPTFNQSLSLFLSQTPVYRLDSSRKNEARIKDKVEALKVEPGRLVIPFKVL